MQPSKFTTIDVVDQAFRKSMALYIGDNGHYYCLSVIKEDIFIFLFIRSIGPLKRVVFEICQNNGQANFIRGPMALNFLPNKTREHETNCASEKFSACPMSLIGHVF